MPSFVAILLLALPTAGATSAPVADTMLQRGRYRMAAQQYQRALKQRPDDDELRIGLARAWAGLGWCAQALPELELLGHSAAFDDKAALAMGSCLADEGRHVEAIALFEEAEVLSGGGSGAEIELAWAAWFGGDLPLFDAITNLQIDEDPMHRGALLLQALRAWGQGDLLAMDWFLEDLDDRQQRAPKADLLRGWAALELGDNEDAIEAFRGPSRFARLRMPVVSTWLAEANRRAGRLDEAQRILEQDLRERGIAPTREALRLRLQVDQEGPDAARASAERLLATLPLEPEVVATAWYVAERAGHAAQATALRERYEALVPPGRRPLDRLPPPSTETP